MRRAVVLFAVLCLLAMAAAAHAVTLEQGWYADIDAVEFYIHMDPYGSPELGGNAYFSMPPGAYGPFQVTNDGVPVDIARYVSVPYTVSEVGPQQSLVLPINVPLGVGANLAGIRAGLSTNYDPARMYLSFWHGDRELWTRRVGTTQAWAGWVAGEEVLDGNPFYFKVQVVPEPTTLMGLVGSILCLLPIRRRRA